MNSRITINFLLELDIGNWNRKQIAMMNRMLAEEFAEERLIQLFMERLIITDLFMLLI